MLHTLHDWHSHIHSLLCQAADLQDAFEKVMAAILVVGQDDEVPTILPMLLGHVQHLSRQDRRRLVERLSGDHVAFEEPLQADALTAFIDVVIAECMEQHQEASDPRPAPKQLALTASAAPAMPPAEVQEQLIATCADRMGYCMKVLNGAMQFQKTTPNGQAFEDCSLERLADKKKTRGKSWVIIDARLPDLRLLSESELSALAVKNYLFGTFAFFAKPGLIRLVAKYNSSQQFKYKDLDHLPSERSYMSIPHGGQVNKHVCEVMEQATAACSYSYGTLKFVLVKHEDTILKYSECWNALSNTTWKEYMAMKADAKVARKNGHPTPLQAAILTYPEEINDFMKAREKLSSTIYCADAVTLDLRTSFSPNLLDLKCVFYDDVENAVGHCSLKEYMMTSQRIRRMLFIIGTNGSGKSSLLQALCKCFCMMNRKDTFVLLKASLDMLGLMTQSGQIEDHGAFAFTDFSLKSQKDVPLGEEDMKSFFDPNEVGCFTCRWHDAAIPKFRPRLGAVNSGKMQCKSKGDMITDYGWWFEVNRCPPGAALARGDEAELQKMSDHHQAIARRIMICKIENREQIGLKVEKVIAAVDDMIAEENQILEAYLNEDVGRHSLPTSGSKAEDNRLM